MAKSRVSVDVIIVGAGPVGGFAAHRLTQLGLSVLMLEEHAEVGKPFQCAGLVNPSSMKRVNLYDTVLTDVFGARMYSPSGIEVKIGKAGQVRTHVVCRKMFDEGVVRLAIDSGADLWLESQPISAEVDDSGVVMQVMKSNQQIEVSASLLIGADGAHSWTRRYFRMGKCPEMMIGYQVEVVGYEGESGYLDMFTGSDVAPGLFAWVIPNGQTHRIGVWSRPEDLDGRSSQQLLDHLMNDSDWSDRFADCMETARFCGPIPCGFLRKPWRQRILLLGDAGGMAKPTTGGGIGPGFDAVELVVEGLVEAVKKDRLDEKSMKRLAKPMMSLRKRQEKARALRDLFVTNCSDHELDENFSIFARPEVIRLINEEGDIERPVPLGMSLLRKVPQFRGLAVKAGFELIKAR